MPIFTRYWRRTHDGCLCSSNSKGRRGIRWRLLAEDSKHSHVCMNDMQFVDCKILPSCSFSSLAPLWIACISNFVCRRHCSITAYCFSFASSRFQLHLDVTHAWNARNAWMNSSWWQKEWRQKLGATCCDKTILHCKTFLNAVVNFDFAVKAVKSLVAKHPQKLCLFRGRCEMVRSAPFLWLLLFDWRSAGQSSTTKK